MSTDTAAFPPRAELPRGLAGLVEPLPFLGTSWYERGRRYWLRRVGYTLFWVLLAGLDGLLLGGLFAVILAASVPGFAVALAVEAVLCLISGGHMWRRLRAQAAGRRAPQRRPAREARRLGATGAALGLLAGTGSVLSQALLVIGAILSFGAFAAFGLRSLLPVLDHERPVRRRLAQVLTARGYDLPPG